MKINKQLFEDVLSGKLKGTFVLRGGNKIDSGCLKRTEDTSLGSSLLYPYALVDKDNGTLFLSSYTELGQWHVGGSFSNDIIDFIQDTDMKTNCELSIEIPDGKIVDWDESKKRNKIVFKDKQLTYEKICDELLGMIDIPLFNTPSKDGNALVVNEHYLECILAKNKLATVAKYLNDGWKPLYDSDIFLLIETKTGVSEYEVMNGSCASDCGSIWFKSKELARQAIEILGEETVKLALEPLGI